MQIFLRLLRYARPHKVRLGMVFMLALLGIVIEMARPWPIKIVVDYALHPERPIPGWLSALSSMLPGAATREGLLLWAVTGAILIATGSALLTWGLMKATVQVAQALVSDLSRELFAKLQRLALTWHGRHEIGDLLQRLSADVFVVYFAVAQVALPVVVSLLCLGGMFAIMAQLDFTLALVALLVVPLLALALIAFVKPMDRTTTAQLQKLSSLTAFAQQSLTAIRLIQGFARETYVRKKFHDRAYEFEEAYVTANVVSTAYKELTTLITAVAAAVLLWLGAGRVREGRLTVGDLLVFLGYLAAMYGPVNALTAAVGYAIAVVARGRRVFEIIDSQEIVQESSQPIIPHKRAQGEVTFENVTFGYRAKSSDTGDEGQVETPVLCNVSFQACPGQIIAIVGATGAGKTSLISLIVRFFDPWQGRVLVDNCDIRDLSLAWLRENISLVLQESFLFPMSVAENIAFGRPGATREEIIAAAQVAQAHDFIERLPQGYDTVLGERTDALSGGERQRLAIARALLKDAPILILDEPTSALDAHTERKIFDALSQLMAGRTTFIISHRLSTIRRADLILALEDGFIVERGTHESLLVEDKVYAHLYRHQHIAAL